jgi:photosystem II stability/assembly factor-like uncharacterized protein
MNKISLLSVFFLSLFSFAQQPSTTANDLIKGVQQKEEKAQKSILRKLPFKNIGPTIMSGRITAFAVNPNDPTEFYAGYATGGVWHTKNNGITFTPILDNAITQNVGSLAVDWKNNTIWVGTGEVNASRSSYAGIGLLKSTDNGKTWTNMGLQDSHHISSILINPENPDEIVVGAVGHLYSKNNERGIFKSTDGGKSWNKTLFVNDQSGIIELVEDPNDFKTMYASSWDKDRKAWDFRESGTGSGIYKSVDAGNTWKKISSENSGFPTGEGVGRIGLAVFDQNLVYAIVDNQNRKTESESTESQDGLTTADFKKMTVEQLLNLENDKLQQFLRSNGFQEKYRAESVKNMVRSGTVLPQDLANYLEDASSIMFNTPVIGAEVYKSTDGGVSWGKTHQDDLDGLYFSYGYYFGKVHVDPSNKDKIYIYGVPILKSDDGGKTFVSIGADNVHADHHALWINPERSGHLINGNDGGINISYDEGESWVLKNSPAVGQFYAVNVDNETPYNVYGGLQDNGVWVGPHTYRPGRSWEQRGEYPYKSIMGGDGMQVQIDNRNSDIVYTGFQFGNYYRLDRGEDKSTYIQPKHELGERPYRFNWQTPIQLSSHNQDILYLGGNKLMRSMNRGDDWTAISKDLTKGGKVGDVAFGTLTSISESPFQFGLIYTGSDDGLIHVTKNGGGDWLNISKNLPKDLWVSRVIASAHKKERVYATLNGYRWDDFKPYVYMSDDYGNTWKNISANLSASPVNVIKEDPENENLLYLGTDNGAYASLDRGESWDVFAEGLPNVAVHDLVIQQREKDLILGTHGRSIYLGDISLLQKMKKENRNEIIVADLSSLNHSNNWGRKFNKWRDVYEPSAAIYFYSPENGTAVITVKSEEGAEMQKMETPVIKGINTHQYDISATEAAVKNIEKDAPKKADSGKFYLPKGKYEVLVNVNGKESKTSLEIK